MNLKKKKKKKTIHQLCSSSIPPLNFSASHAITAPLSSIKTSKSHFFRFQVGLHPRYKHETVSISAARVQQELAARQRLLIDVIRNKLPSRDIYRTNIARTRRRPSKVSYLLCFNVDPHLTDKATLNQALLQARQIAAGFGATLRRR